MSPRTNGFLIKYNVKDYFLTTEVKFRNFKMFFFNDLGNTKITSDTFGTKVDIYS
jgi:hypothetical protein